MLVFILFSTEVFHWRKPCVLPLLLFRQSSSISFHRVQGCSICTCPFRVLVPEVSLQLFVSLCSKCLWWCFFFLKSSMMHQRHTWHLHPDVGWKAQSLLTQAVTDLVWYGCLLSSHGESWAKYILTEPIPLQVEDVAVEFVSESFCPSGPCLHTMKISTQLCHGDTSYFTHNWETRGGQKRLPSRTGPKDLPTAPYSRYG